MGEILGEELDRRRVLLPEAIRHVGVYTVVLRLSRSVQPQIQDLLRYSLLSLER